LAAGNGLDTQGLAGAVGKPPSLGVIAPISRWIFLQIGYLLMIALSG
jgi:hypothetical protein